MSLFDQFLSSVEKEDDRPKVVLSDTLLVSITDCTYCRQDGLVKRANRVTTEVPVSDLKSGAESPTVVVALSDSLTVTRKAWVASAPLDVMQMLDTFIVSGAEPNVTASTGRLDDCSLRYVTVALKERAGEGALLTSLDTSDYLLWWGLSSGLGNPGIKVRRAAAADWLKTRLNILT